MLSNKLDKKGENMIPKIFESDYLGWASLDKNNWEKIGGDGGKYARVRN